MYPIAENIRKLFASGALQKARITVFQKDGSTYVLTDSDICDGGLSVDRYSVTGQTLELGSAVASELSLMLRNDGALNDKQFQGAELFVEVGVVDSVTPRMIQTENGLQLQTESAQNIELEIYNALPSDTEAATAYVPLGWFKVDSPPRKLSTISVSALDRMIRFDKDVEKSDLSFPYTVSELLLEICRICNVQLSDNSVSSLTNADYEIQSLPEQENLTYRTLLMWIAQIAGTCAYMDWDGKLRLGWYENKNPVMSIDESARHDSDLQEQAITITGIEIHTNDGTVLQSAVFQDNYVISIEGNLLLQGNEQAVADVLGNKIVGFQYIPFEAQTLSMPFLFPMDCVDFVKSGTTHRTVLTNVNYALNGSTILAAKGETEEIRSLPSLSPFTPEQTKINQKREETIEKALSAQESAAQYLNQTAASAMGMYYSERTDENGGVIRYWHDNESLENSQYICMQNAGGSFSTNTGWNNGNPQWTEGTDKFGNAVVSLLNAIGIQAEWIRADSITTDKLSIGQVERGTNLIEDSSFESNSLCVRGTFDEEGTTLITPGHNDYWNAVYFSASDEYDISYAEMLDAPSVGGFDGNKGILDYNLKGWSSGDELWFTGVEHIEPIPVEMMSHIVSFYCRVKNAPREQTQTAEVVHAKYAFKIQWLDFNKNPISSMIQTFDVKSNGTSEWNRIHAEVIPVNGAKYAKFAIGFQCTDEPVWNDGGETGEQGYKDIAFLDLDGILFEQGTALNAWTCAQSEVDNTGVLIDSNGLNIADGKIYVKDPFGRNVFYLDGQQAMQLIGGLTTQIFDPVSKKAYAQISIQPDYKGHLWDESGSLTGAGHLQQVFEKADKNGKMQTVASIGMGFSNDENTNNDYPLSFFSKNGFEFNGAKSLISDPVYVHPKQSLNNIKTPGWYYNNFTKEVETMYNVPKKNAFLLRVECIKDIILQTFTAVDLSYEYKRWYRTWEPVGWSDWKITVQTVIEHPDIRLASMIEPGTYIVEESDILFVQKKDSAVYADAYPVKKRGVLECFRTTDNYLYQRYTTWDGYVYIRNSYDTGWTYWHNNGVAPGI